MRPSPCFQRISRVCGLVVLMALAETRVSAQAPFFTTSTPGVVSGAGGTLGVTLPVSNSGTVRASSVKITSIQLSTAPLIAPTTFPFSPGDIPAGSTFLILASFNGNLLTVGAHYLFSVRGTYSFGNSIFGFTVNRFVTIPGPPRFLLGINKTDQLLLEAQAATGETVDYFGPKDTNGLATGLTTVLVRTSSGQFRYDTDSQSRLVRVLNADGTTFNMQWSSATSVLLTATSADGAKQLSVPIDLSNRQFALSHKQGPKSTGLGLRKQVSRASFSGMAALDETAGRGRALRTSEHSPGPSVRYCSLTSTLAAGEAMSTAQSDDTGICGTDACVTVNHCGPVDNATVSVTYAGSIVLPLPGKSIGSGAYDVKLPSTGLGSELSNILQGCEAAANALETVCKEVEALGAICLALTATVEGTVFGLECLEGLEPYVLACTINGGTLPPLPGAPDINHAFCSFVTGTINLANKLVNSTPVTLIPTAALPGFGTVHGQPTETTAGCSTQGNCPTMPITFSCTQTYHLTATFDDGATLNGTFTLNLPTLTFVGTPTLTASSPVSGIFPIGLSGIQGATVLVVFSSAPIPDASQNAGWFLSLYIPFSSLASPGGGPICATLAPASACENSTTQMNLVNTDNGLVAQTIATSGTVTPVSPP